MKNISNDIQFNNFFKNVPIPRIAFLNKKIENRKAFVVMVFFTYQNIQLKKKLIITFS